MPAIDDFVMLVYFNRRKRVEDVGVLRDQIVVALAKPGVQVVPEYDVVEGRSFVGSPYCDCRMIEGSGKLPLRR